MLKLEPLHRTSPVVPSVGVAYFSRRLHRMLAAYTCSTAEDQLAVATRFCGQLAPTDSRAKARCELYTHRPVQRWLLESQLVFPLAIIHRQRLKQYFQRNVLAKRCVTIDGPGCLNLHRRADINHKKLALPCSSLVKLLPQRADCNPVWVTDAAE